VVTYVPGTLRVTGAPLTITANPATKVYGAANPAFSVTAAGLLPPDTLVSLGFLRNCTTTATATSPVGTYPINCSASTINAPNYAVTYVAGTLTVTQANSSTTITAHRPSPSNIGAVVTVSFRVTPQIAGGAATGNVTVTASTGETCTGTLLLNLGSCPVTFTTPGLRTLTASYAGDNNLRSSVSVAVSHIVTSPAASVAPNSLVFAAQRVNTNSPTQAVTLANLGNGTLNISGITISGPNATSFTRVAGGCGATLLVGRTCLITVRLRPTTVGPMNATLTINSNDPVNPVLAVALSGTGVLPAATLSTTSLTFAAQTRNTTSAPQAVTLTNVGSAPLVITSVAVVTGNANNYIVTNVDCPIGGAGLAANGSCTVNVAFRPNAVGTRSSTLRFVDNAVPTTQTVTLSGTGQ
jgi:MBG domain (YGX type)/Bacterial Ig-like domain (group 3)